MKLTEVKGWKPRGEYWPVHNKSGVVKKFKKIDGVWEDAAAVKQWLESSGDPKAEREFTRDAARREREAARYEREDARNEKREAKRAAGGDVDLEELYRKTIDAVSSSFPDGDPIDHLIPYLRKKGVTHGMGELIDKALRKHGDRQEKKGLYPYLKSTWEWMADDALTDAEEQQKKNPKFDPNNGSTNMGLFVKLDKDGKLVKKGNPW